MIRDKIVGTRYLKAIDQDVKIEIYPEAEAAIKYGWENLAFTKKSYTFARIETENGYIGILKTKGTVIATDIDADVSLNNTDEAYFRECIEKYGQNMRRHVYVERENQFVFMYGTVNGLGEFQLYDDLEFDMCPLTIEELKVHLIDFFVFTVKSANNM